jgi:anthrone oxygenase-like protein
MEAELQARHTDAGSAGSDRLSFCSRIVWFDGGWAWLVGGLLLLVVIPFTLVVILTTNKRLETQELDLRSEEADRLVRRWGRLHAARTLLSGAALVLFLIGLAGLC